MKSAVSLGVFTLLGCLLGTQPAQAIPVLQLYVEGGQYDAGTDTWTISGASPVRLWVIGNVDGPAGKGAITDVRLSAAYSSADAGLLLSLTPSTTGAYHGVTDPSTPVAPVLQATVTDGSSPVLSDGNSLTSHGNYGVGIHWQEFLLDALSLTDSPIADFNGNLPFPAPADFFANAGQINVYELTADRATSLHFDLYGTTTNPRNGKTSAEFAPPSHDAEADVEPGDLNHVVPELGSAIVWSNLALLFGVVFWWRGRRACGRYCALQALSA